MSDRMRRVNSILRELLAEEVERMNDPRLDLVSVTGVDTAPNLRRATVYIDALGPDDHEEALAALTAATTRLQGAIGAQARLKYTPTLDFAMDPGVVGGARIDAILRGLREEE